MSRIERLARKYVEAWRACDEWYGPGANYNHEIGEKTTAAWGALMDACAEPPRPITPEAMLAAGATAYQKHLPTKWIELDLHDGFALELCGDHIFISSIGSEVVQRTCARNVRTMADVLELARLIGRDE